MQPDKIVPPLASGNASPVLRQCKAEDRNKNNNVRPEILVQTDIFELRTAENR
jgi:hypothetical protein